MNSTARNNRRNRRSRLRTMGNDRRVTERLDQLIRFSKAQITHGLPSIPDVSEIQLKRQKVYTFSVYTQGDIVTTSTTVDVLGAYQFALTPVSTPTQGPSNTTEFTALFDQYRIVQVVAQFTPDHTTTDTNLIYTAIDYDDGSSPATMSALQQYGTCQFDSLNGTYFERVFHPRAALAAYSGTVFTSFANASPNQWYDVASPTIPFYGLKFGIGPAAAVNHLRIGFKLLIQFRNNR